MLRLAVLASGGGSNLQSILDASERSELGVFQPVLVVADRSCAALNRGKAAGLPTVLLDRRIHGTNLSCVLAELLKEHRIDFAALAGWLSILDEDMTRTWKGRMVNIHPSLLPRHGGVGMYGIRVHQAVLNAGDPESGCSVHFVTGEVDGGDILGQSRVPVLKGESPEDLAARILVEEHKLYPAVLSSLSEKLILDA